MDVISMSIALANKELLERLATNLDDATEGQVLTAQGDGTADFESLA